MPPRKAETGGKEGATQIWHLASRREPRRRAKWTGGMLLACFLPAVNSVFEINLKGSIDRKDCIVVCTKLGDNYNP